MELPEVAKKAIQSAFPNDAERILTSIVYDSTLGCWLFAHCGMLVGVEKDGHIHS